MPLHITLDALPFRHRSKTLPTPSSSGDETDESSPERGQPRIIHIPTTKHGRKSGERLVSIADDGRTARGVPEKKLEGTHIALPLDKARHLNLLDRRQTKKSVKPDVVSASPDVSDQGALTKTCQPPTKPTLIRRVASKLNIAIPSKSHALHSRPSTRTLPGDTRPSTLRPRPSKVTLPSSPTLPNSFGSKEHREAALRERGLLPPCKDLSEQEREADERIACVPLPTPINGSSEADLLKAKWLSMNATSESSDSDCGPQSIPGSPTSSAPSDMDHSRRSCEGKVDLPAAGRPSICSSVNALSASSYLEVLHEDPSELGPITPPPPLMTDLPVIVSSPVEDEFPGPPEIVESPVSCSFSTHLAVPGSAFDSPDIPPPLPEKDNAHDPASPASRRRTTGSSDRRRKVVGPTLSRFGTTSLSNLRRSVVGTLGLPSSSALSGTDIPSSPTASHLAFQAPRTAISPTIHSRGSILLETRDIQDAESRRLSELAFLD